MPRINAPKRPTWTSLIEEQLIKADDFMSVGQLMKATGASNNQVTAALHHLRNRHAVDSVLGGDGYLWWFATPSSDDRAHKVEERRPEEPGTRRPRRAARARQVK